MSVGREIYVLQGPRPLAAAWSALCSCLSSSSRGRSIERSEGAEGAKSAKGARREPLPPPPEEQEELEQQLQVAAYAVVVPLLLAAPFHPSAVLRVEASVGRARWC